MYIRLGNAEVHVDTLSTSITIVVWQELLVVIQPSIHFLYTSVRVAFEHGNWDRASECNAPLHSWTQGRTNELCQLHAPSIITAFP